MLPSTVTTRFFDTTVILRYADPDGGTDLESVAVRIGTHREDTRCEIGYRRSTNVLTLGAQTANMAGGGVLDNGNCRVSVSQSNVYTEGTRLELVLRMEMSFVGGLAVYQSAVDRAGNSWPWTATRVAGGPADWTGPPVLR